MKASLLAIGIAAAFSVAVASAQGNATPAMNMDMGRPAQGAAAPGAPAMQMDGDKQGAQTQANMAKMQQQMDRISTTKDPKERQKLLQEHMVTMQENMKAMRAMGNSMHKGGSAPMTMGNRGSMPNDDMQKRQEMGEKRMDMMQEMMNQMMQRDKAMAPMGHM